MHLQCGVDMPTGGPLQHESRATEGPRRTTHSIWNVSKCYHSANWIEVESLGEIVHPAQFYIVRNSKIAQDGA